MFYVQFKITKNLWHNKGFLAEIQLESLIFSPCFQKKRPPKLVRQSLRSPPVFYPLRRYENKWDFHQLMSTKSKMHSRRFCSQKHVILFVAFGKSVGLFGETISFHPFVLTLLYNSKIAIISIITLYIQGNKLFECSSDIVRSGYPYRYVTCGSDWPDTESGNRNRSKERRNNLTSRKKCAATCTSDAGTPIWR